MKRFKTKTYLALLLQGTCVSLLAVEVPLITPMESEATAGFYSVTDHDTQVELKTPYGTLNIPTDFGTHVPYRFSIPIEQLKKGAPPVVAAAEEPEEKEKAKEREREVSKGTDPPLPSASPLPTPAKPVAATVIVDDADALVVDANRLFNRRRYYEALTVVDQLLRKRPDFARGWLMKGSLLSVQGHKDLALKAWLKAKEIDPENPEILSVLERYQ